MNAPEPAFPIEAPRTADTLTRTLRRELYDGHENIPAALKDLKCWIAWKVGGFTPSGDFTKVPYYPSGVERRGTDGDLSGLGTWEEAAAAWTRDKSFAGVGIVAGDSVTPPSLLADVPVTVFEDAPPEDDEPFIPPPQTAQPLDSADAVSVPNPCTPTTITAKGKALSEPMEVVAEPAAIAGTKVPDSPVAQVEELAAATEAPLATRLPDERTQTGPSEWPNDLPKACLTVLWAKNALQHRKGYRIENGRRIKIPAKPFFNGEAKYRNATLHNLFDVLKVDLGDRVGFMTGTDPGKGDRILGSNFRRSKQKFQHADAPTFCCIDVDALSNWLGLKTPADVVRALRSLDPQDDSLNVDMVTSSSASSYVEGGEEKPSGLKGLHVWFQVTKGTHIPAILETLDGLCWLNGWGRAQIGSSGRVLFRSLVDLALKTSNQMVYEGGANCKEGITQARRVEFHPGKKRMLTLKGPSSPGPAAPGPGASTTSLAPLDWKELQDIAKSKAEAAASLAEEAARVHAEWLGKRVAHLPETDRPAAMKVLHKAFDAKHRDLPGWFDLTLADGSTMPVAALLEAIAKNPEQWDGELLPDPYEPDYRADCATVKVHGQTNGKPKILSMAHGVPAIYHLHPGQVPDRPSGSDDFTDLEGEAGAEPYVATTLREGFKDLFVTDEIAAELQTAEFLIPNLVIRGQVTGIIARSNGGKTTIMNHHCPELVAKGCTVLYFNLDGNGDDIIRHRAHAKQHGYEVVSAELFRKSNSDIIQRLRALLNNGASAAGTVLIFDTVKKLVDMIDKNQLKALLALMRQVTYAGGTVVLIGHANKNLGADGSLIFEGTEDFKSDIDTLIYLESELNSEGTLRTVVTRPDKVRGTFIPRAYTISLPDRVVTELEEVPVALGIEGAVWTWTLDALHADLRSQKEIVDHIRVHVTVGRDKAMACLASFVTEEKKLRCRRDGKRYIYSLPDGGAPVSGSSNSAARPEDFENLDAPDLSAGAGSPDG